MLLDNQARLIVIADPVASTRELLAEVFRSEFDAYLTLLDGTGKLLETLHEALPHLVVVELHVPTDLEAVRAVKSDRRVGGVPVLALTAWLTHLKCADAIEAGSNVCLEKPFDLNELINQASVFLDRPRRAI